MITDRQKFHIERTKLRNVIERQMNSFNRTCHRSFMFKYTSHFVDRMMDRDVSIEIVLQLLKNALQHKKEILNYIRTPYNTRETRLEITDGKYWLGLTLDRYPSRHGIPVLKTRMTFVNENRYPSKISTKVIKVEKVD